VNANDEVILSGPGITAAFEAVGTYEIYLEWSGGYQSVKFRIIEWTQGGFEFYQSHFIKPPGHTGPYQTTTQRLQQRAMHYDRAWTASCVNII
jgi:hypothetical protein